MKKKPQPIRGKNTQASTSKSSENYQEPSSRNIGVSEVEAKFRRKIGELMEDKHATAAEIEAAAEKHQRDMTAIKSREVQIRRQKTVDKQMELMERVLINRPRETTVDRGRPGEPLPPHKLAMADFARWDKYRIFPAMFREETERMEKESRYVELASRSGNLTNLSEELVALNRMVEQEELSLQSAMTQWIQGRQSRGEGLFDRTKIPNSNITGKSMSVRPARRMYDVMHSFIHMLMVTRESILTRPGPSRQDISDMREVLRRAMCVERFVEELEEWKKRETDVEGKVRG